MQFDTGQGGVTQVAHTLTRAIRSFNDVDEAALGRRPRVAGRGAIAARISWRLSQALSGATSLSGCSSLSVIVMALVSGLVDVDGVVDGVVCRLALAVLGQSEQIGICPVRLRGSCLWVVVVMVVDLSKAGRGRGDGARCAVR